DVVALRTRLVLGRVFWCLYPIVLAFQLASNGVLTGRGVVLYNPDDIVGIRFVYAPVEDLAFGFALVLATLSVWVWLGRRFAPTGPSASGSSGAAGQHGAAGQRERRVSRTGGLPRRLGRSARRRPRGRGRRPRGQL